MRLWAWGVALLLVAAGPAAGQDWAKEKLKKSSRHGEYVKVKHGNREVQTWVVYPEVKDKATAVVVIHEIFGLSDWVRLLADEMAEAGYIAIAPDLLSGMGPKGGGTDDFGGGNVMKAIQSLPAKQITADLNAAADYVKKLPACNGKVAACGFCWGGGQVFRFATNNKDLKAAFVFYGSFDHTPTDLARIHCPVYGFYGENDARINKTLPNTEKEMKAAGKKFEPVIYQKSGHGFMRAGEQPGASSDNRRGREQAWERWKMILKSL
jgi:carboxymethylenebutenolidase